MGIYDDTNDVTYYEINRANVDPNLTRYQVYVDGRLDPTAQVNSIENYYNSKLTIAITGDLTASDVEILLVHTPIEYYRQDFSVTSRVFYMKDGLSTGNSPDTIWPDDISSGMILQYHNNRIMNGYPFEETYNIKYS